MCATIEKQKQNLRRTLEAKKEIRELWKTDPQQAERRLMVLVDQLKNRRTRTTWQSRLLARKLRKEKCELCGTTVQLHLHHRNGDRTDNRQENLQTVCVRCHSKQHYPGGGMKN